MICLEIKVKCLNGNFQANGWNNRRGGEMQRYREEGIYTAAAVHTVAYYKAVTEWSVIAMPCSHQKDCG